MLAAVFIFALLRTDTLLTLNLRIITSDLNKDFDFSADLQTKKKNKCSFKQETYAEKTF